MLRNRDSKGSEVERSLWRELGHDTRGTQEKVGGPGEVCAGTPCGFGSSA